MVTTVTMSTDVHNKLQQIYAALRENGRQEHEWVFDRTFVRVLWQKCQIPEELIEKHGKLLAEHEELLGMSMMAQEKVDMFEKLHTLQQQKPDLTVCVDGTSVNVNLEAWKERLATANQKLLICKVAVNQLVQDVRAKLFQKMLQQP